MPRIQQPIYNFLLFFTLLALGACGGDKGGGSSSSDGGGELGDGTIRFTEVTDGSGIVLQNISGDDQQKLAIPENIGQGAAVLDYDSDGDLDIFIANGDVFDGQTPRSETRCALYRNDGDWKFTDVTKEAGLIFKAWCHGAYAIDFDADGDRDLYVTVFMGKNKWFENLGGGKFKDSSSTWGGDDAGPSSCAALFDADNDGDLDLYVGNYVDYDPKNPPNQGNPCVWKDLKVSCGPKGTPPGVDRFYENVDGKLVEATEKFGFTAEASYSLGAVVGDADGDGKVDLYIANDSKANYLFLNQGNGQWKEQGSRLGLDMNDEGRAQAGMGVDFGDVNNDGRLDYFVTNFADDWNTLYINRLSKSGKTIYRDSSLVMRLRNASYRWLSWGTRIFDVNNNGWQDIIAVSGHVYPQVDQTNVGARYKQMNQLFVNQGPSGDAGRCSFTDLASQETGFDKEAVSRGLVTADFDNDGDLDLFIVEMDSTPTLLRNDSNGMAWIGLSLKGKGGNAEAIGTRVEFKDSSGVSRWREVSYGASYFSTSDPRLVCGLGTATGSVTLSIRWPDGTTETKTGLAAGKYHSIEQP